MKNLAEAVLQVMEKVKGIEKNSSIGTGNSSYKGVNDKDVKQIIGKAMREAGLSLLPIGVDSVSNTESWTEKTQWGEKMKSATRVEVTTKYLLLHKSGESVELQGYGHGVDSQDKAAGKATTYALKYALLYTFLVPTGDIDDADATHSDDIPTPPVKKPNLGDKGFA